jgi:hypothetical protein
MLTFLSTECGQLAHTVRNIVLPKPTLRTSQEYGPKRQNLPLETPAETTGVQRFARVHGRHRNDPKKRRGRAAPQVQTPMSPHSHQDWMAIAQQEMEGRPGPRQMRPNSPPRTMVDLQRRDGIRKKNGRIDIPQERNIHTIDQLIETTKDEDMLKELKQQKRLLRNREAAYVHLVHVS